MAKIIEIGRVKNRFNKKTDPFIMKKEESEIEVYPAFAEGLYDIESNKFLQILFHFDRSEKYSLRVKWYYGDEKGVFACRSPNRPGGIGLTTVELIQRRGNILKVKGLDALNKTPVLDIKPLVPHTDFAEENQKILQEFTMQNPRAQFFPMIINKELEDLFVEAGKLHGHYCPGLALGTIASVVGIHKLSEITSIPVRNLINPTEGKHIVAIIELNNCFTDGVQLVSGCTLGNKLLLLNNTGENAVTFCLKKGTGIRLFVKSDYKDYLDKANSSFFKLQNDFLNKENQDPESLHSFFKNAKEAANIILNIPFKELFEITEVKPVF